MTGAGRGGREQGAERGAMMEGQVKGEDIRAVEELWADGKDEGTTGRGR